MTEIGEQAASIDPCKADARHRMIAEAAYYLAEHRGFAGECQLYDWLEAEAMIDHIYGKVE